MSDVSKIHPLHDRIVVKAQRIEQKTKGGIFLPDTADQEKPMTGEVVAIGKGKQYDGKLIPLEVKVGDKVVFGKYSGTNFKMGEEEYLIMREEDVMGILT